jgi:hypothetical protein
MSTPWLVAQLRFTRGEFVRGLAGVSDADARRRLEPMNCISWIVGHLATQENGYWVRVAQDRRLLPDLVELAGTGSPASTPPLEDMWAAWRAVTEAADLYLDTLTPDLLATHLMWKGEPRPENIGTMLLRNIHHYWFHLGEAYAVRQMLGHRNLPEFVGSMKEAGYRLAM